MQFIISQTTLVGKEARNPWHLIHLQLQNREWNSPFRRRGGIPSGGLAKKEKLTGKNILSNLYLAQLVPAALLVLIGIVVIWTASMNIAEASFPRHLLGIGLGLVFATLMWAL